MQENGRELVIRHGHLAIHQAREDRIWVCVYDPNGRSARVSKVQESISVREVKEPRANLLKAGRRAAHQKLRTQRHRWRRLGFFLVVFVHRVA